MHPYHHANAEKRGKAHDLIARTGNRMERRATGGAAHGDAKDDAAMIARAIHEHEAHDHPGKSKTKLKFASGGHIEGQAAHHHMGRRARGGHTGKKGGHVTNVIVAPQGGAPGGMRPPIPAPMPARPAMPVAAPPRPAGPPAMAAGAMGGPPVGMPPAPPPGMRPPGAMKRGGGVRKVEEVGVPSESLMQSKRGGKIGKRDVGGPAGVPANPTQLTPQQLQRIALIRREEAEAMRAREQAASQTQGPMGAAQAASQAARMQGPAMQKRGGEVHVKEHTRRAKGGHVPHMEAGAGGGEGRIEKTHEYGEGGFKPKKVPLHVG